MLLGILVRPLIVAAFAAIGRRDLDRVVGRLAPDVHHRFAGDHALGGERHDREAVRRWFERLFRLYPELTFRVGRVTAGGWPWALRITVEWVADATPLHGEPYRNVGAHVIRFDRGRVGHLHAYEDSQVVGRALQTMAAAGIAEAAAPPITS